MQLLLPAGDYGPAEDVALERGEPVELYSASSARGRCCGAGTIREVTVAALVNIRERHGILHIC